MLLLTLSKKTLTANSINTWGIGPTVRLPLFRISDEQELPTRRQDRVRTEVDRPKHSRVAYEPSRQTVWTLKPTRLSSADFDYAQEIHALMLAFAFWFVIDPPASTMANAALFDLVTQ
jgi:hypothetical protein